MMSKKQPLCSPNKGFPVILVCRLFQSCSANDQFNCILWFRCGSVKLHFPSTVIRSSLQDKSALYFNAKVVPYVCRVERQSCVIVMQKTGYTRTSTASRLVLQAKTAFQASITGNEAVLFLTEKLFRSLSIQLQGKL